MLNDFAVLKKIKEGDVATFETIFRQYYTSLCMYAFGITGCKDMAEEAVQEVFYHIWKGREHITILSSVKNYLYGSVKNQALSYLEHLKVQETYREHILNNYTETERSPQELLEYQELENVITTILDKLPERRRKIFTMHRMEGKKYKEIAVYYAISVKTVEAEMTKAYLALRQGIEKYT